MLTALGSNLIISIFIGGSLNHIWSLLNVLQITQKIRLFDIKAPGIVSSFTSFLDVITSLELIDYEEVLDFSVFQVPETDPFTINF